MPAPCVADGRTSYDGRRSEPGTDGQTSHGLTALAAPSRTCYPTNPSTCTCIGCGFPLPSDPNHTFRCPLSYPFPIRYQATSWHMLSTVSPSISKYMLHSYQMTLTGDSPQHPLPRPPLPLYLQPGCGHQHPGFPAKLPANPPSALLLSTITLKTGYQNADIDVIFCLSRFSGIPKSLKFLKEKKTTYQFPLFLSHLIIFTHSFSIIPPFTHLLSRAWTPVGGNTANLVKFPNFSRYDTSILFGVLFYQVGVVQTLRNHG